MATAKAASGELGIRPDGRACVSVSVHTVLSSTMNHSALLLSAISNPRPPFYIQRIYIYFLSYFLFFLSDRNFSSRGSYIISIISKILRCIGKGRGKEKRITIFTRRENLLHSFFLFFSLLFSRGKSFPGRRIVKSPRLIYRVR